MARTKRKHHHSTHHSAGGHNSTHSRSENNGDHVRHAAARMASSGRDQIGRMQKSARSAFDVFSGPMARMMDQNFSLFQRTVQTVQEESLRFFNRRMEHTSHIIENSRDFQGVSGLMQLQQEWMLELARDCSEQATRFAHLMREIAMDSTERLSETSSELLQRAEKEMEAAEDEYESAQEHHAAA